MFTASKGTGGLEICNKRVVLRIREEAAHRLVHTPRSLEHPVRVGHYVDRERRYICHIKQAYDCMIWPVWMPADPVMQVLPDRKLNSTNAEAEGYFLERPR